MGRVASPRAARPYHSSPLPEHSHAARRNLSTPRIHSIRFAAFSPAGDPLHGPRRRGPASRLPCATRRHGPPPPSDRSAFPTWPGRLSSTPCLAPTSRTHTARRLRRHRPAHVVCLAPLVGAAVHVRVVGAGFASSSLPVTPFMFTTLSTIAAMSAPFPSRRRRRQRQ